MTLRSVSLLVFFFLFFCLIFTSFFVCLFVYLFWRECDILLTNLTMENLRFFLFLVCSIFSLFYILFRLVFFFFVFLFNFYFLLGLFVCLFACFDDSVIFYSQVSQWRSCDFFFVLSLFYILFRRKKKQVLLELT